MIQEVDHPHATITDEGAETRQGDHHQEEDNLLLDAGPLPAEFQGLGHLLKSIVIRDLPPPVVDTDC